MKKVRKDQNTLSIHLPISHLFLSYLSNAHLPISLSLSLVHTPATTTCRLPPCCGCSRLRRDVAPAMAGPDPRSGETTCCPWCPCAGEAVSGPDSRLRSSFGQTWRNSDHRRRGRWCRGGGARVRLGGELLELLSPRSCTPVAAAASRRPRAGQLLVARQRSDGRGGIGGVDLRDTLRWERCA